MTKKMKGKILMSEEAGTVLELVFIFIIIAGLGFALGRCIENEINQKICKQLYQQNINKYINCSTKDINKNIKLIKDTTNDR